jgi:small subunit ribosomal protein S20
MPIIKSAVKKLRKDKKRTKANLIYKKAYREAIKKLKKTKTKKLLAEVYSKIDKALKKRIIHKNKANRLKSKVTQLLKTK